jgi:hypothetical protein
MKLFRKAPDGGKDSGVTAYFLFESKRFGSVALLRFSKGTREAYHSHAFNARTWWLWGSVTEHHLMREPIKWRPSFKPKFTPRECFHKIVADEVTWAFTIRGPWQDKWKEWRSGEFVTLTHGRKIVK